MEVSDIPIPAQVAATAPATYEHCDHCAAPVDGAQRYCVVCGAHRRHVSDPAARYFSALTARDRAAGRQPGSPTQRRPRNSGLGLALLLAVIPLAVATGVLVGRASTNGDQKLIAALRAQRPDVVRVGGGTAVAAASSTTAASTLTSDFPLQRGYSIELQTLPGSGTDQAAVDKAERAARAKGAKNVGLIAQSDFKVTPRPAAGAYVIYSGAFKTQAQASTALKKLTKAFPHAKVIRVQATGNGSGAAGQTLSKTQYGSARQISGFTKPTQSQLQQGAQVVQRVQQTQGKSYLNSQRGLPDQVSVP